MKFAIPIADGRLSLHFGHSKEFAIIDVENGGISSKEVLEPPPHEPGVLPKWLNDKGVNVIIAGGMGHKAKDFFSQYGIEVVVGAMAQPPEDLVKSYLSKTLVTGPNACDH